MSAAKPKTRAVGYVRVSTEGQALEGVSLDAQRAKILAYCELHTLEVLSIQADEGISAKRADNRPGLQAALDLVCKRKAVLIIYSLTRLARSTRDAIQIVDRLERAGADLASISEKIDTTSSMGRFFFRLMASLGELERDQISDRTTAAMAHLRRQGRRISGAIPYGCDLAADGQRLESNAVEAAVITRLQAERAAGATYRQLAASLNEAGVKAKGGAGWYPASVRAVLLAAAARCEAA